MEAASYSGKSTIVTRKSDISDGRDDGGRNCHGPEERHRLHTSLFFFFYNAFVGVASYPIATELASKHQAALVDGRFGHQFGLLLGVAGKLLLAVFHQP